MIVLSLFDGMSCGRIALSKLGVDVDKYYASEVDKPAIEESRVNWPNTEHLGDIRSWRDWDIPWDKIDLLLGGSPCQGFSSAGVGQGFKDPRSILFFSYVDILNHLKVVNPYIKFLFENVNMKGEWTEIISANLGVSPVLINSSLVTAQLRSRNYWCNWKVTEPENKGVVLQSILDGGFITDREKSFCLDANYSKGSNPRSYFKGRRQIVYQSESKTAAHIVRGVGVSRGSVYDISQKEYTEWKNNKETTKPFRTLSLDECCRLQTVPLGYFKNSSKAQAIKMLGNGWTIDVITHLLGCGIRLKSN